MALDGKTLALARERLLRMKEENETEHERRKREIYYKAPEIKEMDARLRMIMMEVFAIATGKKGSLADLEEESLTVQMKKAERLCELGYSAEYLSEICDCKICKDSGYVMGRMCDCLKALYRDESAKRLSDLVKTDSGNFADFKLNFYDDNVDYKLGASPRKRMEIVKNACEIYAQNFSINSINLLLRGAPGLGKTFLSACIAREVAKRGYSVVYETAQNAFEAMEERKFSRDPESVALEKTRKIFESDLLILDDLGTELPGAFSTAALYQIISTRIAEKKPMILVTGFSQIEISKRYSAQIASRIDGDFHALEFCGRDIRTIKKERGI